VDPGLPRPHGRGRPEALLTLGELALGLLALGAVLGGCGLAAWLVVARALPWLDGAPRALAVAVWWTAAVIAVHLVPGILGVLVPEAAVVATGALLGGVALWNRRDAGPVRAGGDLGRRGPPADGRFSTALALGVLIAVAGCAIGLLRDIAGTPLTSIDALNFQVPVVARWLQEDSIWGLHQFIADYSNATYPHNGNVLVAAVMAPFDSAFLARLVAVPYWALTGVATYAIARELHAPRATSALAATALLAMPVSIRSGLEGVQTDLPMLAMLGAGVLFLVRCRGHAEIVTAGLALGLAFGTKWYAVTGVAVIVAIWALTRPRPRDAVTLLALIAAGGGFWLVRNWIATGNPLFPQPLPLFPSPPDPLREAGGFTLAHYAFDFGIWDTYLRPAFASSFGWAGAIFVTGAVAAATLRPPRRVVVVAAGTFALFALYLVTPYSAFGPEGRPVLAQASTRYALPALIGAAVLTAWLAARGGRMKVAVELLLAAVTLDGLRRGFELPKATLAFGLLAAGALAAAIRFWPHGRTATAAAVAAVAIAGVAVADVSRDRAETQTYGPFDPVLAYLERQLPEGRTIGLAGVWSPEAVAPPLPAFGPRLGNEVAYVGEFVEGMLRPYRDREKFVRALETVDLLIVGRASATPEEPWAAGAGWTLVTASSRLAAYRPPGG